MLVQNNIYQNGKSSVSVQRQGLRPLPKTTVKQSSHHNKHPNEHLETSLQDIRLRKRKLTSYVPLNVANMEYSQKGSRHLEVSHYNI